MKLDNLKFYDYKDGSFKDLDVFDYPGVYIIFEPESKEIVYIGSAYARTIKTRLKQYLSSKDTGNTLGKAIAKKNSEKKKATELTDAELDKAVELIKKYHIRAIEHKDLEYDLISKANPKYNNLGKEKERFIDDI